MTRPWAWVPIGLLLACAACVTPEPSPPTYLADAPPRIEPPPAPRRPVVTARTALPPNARVQFPAHDGDSFLIVMPAPSVATPTVERIRDEVIAPTLRAIGFAPGIAGLGAPAAGVEMPSGAAVRRRETQYVFRQLVGGVPVEHAAVIASLRAGGDSVTVRGAVAGCYADPACSTIANKPALAAGSAVQAASAALARMEGVERAGAEPIGGAQRVLLPYGTDSAGRAELRHAVRTGIEVVFRGHPGTVIVWIDAETGGVLKLESLLKPATVSASGRVVVRDPSGGTTVASFTIDDAVAGQYRLQWTDGGFANRVDYQGDGLLGFNTSDVSLPAGGGGTTAVANFDVAPINDLTRAICKTGVQGGNAAFQQVNLFATLQRQHAAVLAGGIFTPFPTSPFAPRVESGRCGSWSTMEFGACDGYAATACPALTASPDGGKTSLNFALDNTMIGHELGHQATARLTLARPADWCAPGPPTAGPACPLPIGWGSMHDLADFWGAHLESSSCIGGWVAQNFGGVGKGLHCADRHSEGGALPRKLDPAVDHFPEHRYKSGITLLEREYADGQIGAAALWAARLGVHSRFGASGVADFGAAFQSALRNAGFMPVVFGSSDLGMYQQLQDLLRQLAEVWVSASDDAASGVNKVLAGFASAGVFLVPTDCLGPAAAVAANCPDAQKGADAVVDVDDQDSSNDDTVNQVPHPVHDFLKLGGTRPRFTVWTGPRYRLDGPAGERTRTTPAPCNAEFRVELSQQGDFTGPTTVASSWRTVSQDAKSSGQVCRGRWRPSSTAWATVTQNAQAGTRIYYRATTRDGSGGSVRVSTSPGNGLWTVPPAVLTLTPTGRP